MDFRVLGPLEIRDGERALPLGGFRQRLVLGVLLLHPNRALSADWLVDAVWGEDPPRTARKTLQVYVSRLRSLLGPQRIEAAAAGYIVHLAADDIDSARFEQLADEGHRLLSRDPAAAARVLHRALSLWRGMPWGDLGDEPAILPEAQRFRERRLVTIEDRIEADLELGRAAGVVGELEALAEEHPFRERFHAQLMLALYRSGRQSDALRAFQSARRCLGEELGIEPSPELQQLEEQILLQDPALEGASIEAELDDWTHARNPYKGLRAFRREDCTDFFGRLDLVDNLVERVEHDRFIAVVGASGSGKSSVVMAGLLPRLAPDQWTVATMVPGRRPFAALLSALRETRLGPASALTARSGDNLQLLRIVQTVVPDDGPRLLLVIDQFEELLHQGANLTTRVQFIRNLVEVIEDPNARVTVLVTLRADFFDAALEQSPLGELIGGEVVAVLPLRGHELEAAAARPAERAGIHMEPELVAELVGEMTDQSGALPLFQYVLTELFDGRTGPVMARAAYRRIGGLTGALSRRAEDTYLALDADVQAVARQVFMRLVTVGTTGDDSRRRVDRESLEALDPAGNSVKAVLDALDEARLLTFDRNPIHGGATVEVAHEALLREWPRLHDWLDAAREDLRLHGALVAEVADWESSGSDPDYLLTGTRLEQYDDWTATTSIALTEPEEAFLTASAARRDDEVSRGRRSVRRLRSLVAIVSVAALAAAALTVFAANRSREASASQREARGRELANAALATAEADPDLGILLALEAIDTTRAVDGFVVREAEEALHVAVGAHRLRGSVRGQWDVAFHPDGGLVVAGDPVRLIDQTTGEVRLELATPRGEREVESVAVSTDGALIATGTSGRGWVTVWDGRTGAEVSQLGPVGDTVFPLEFSPDGRLLAALAPGPGTLVVWERETWDPIVRRSDPEAREVFGPREGIALNADRTRLAMTAGDDVWILDMASREWITTLVGHDSLTTSVAFIPGRETLVTGSMDGTFRFWDIASGVEVGSVNAGVGQLVSLVVSDNGDLLLTGGDGGTVRLWELQSNGARAAATLQGVRSMVINVAFDASGTAGTAIGMGGEVVSWDVTVAGPGEAAAWHAKGPVAFSPDDGRLAAGDPLGRGVVIASGDDWERDLALEDVVPYVGTENLGYGSEWGALGGIAMSPDGRLIVTSTHGYGVVPGTVTAWDASTGDREHTLITHDDLRGSAAFSAAGNRIAAGTCGPPGSPATVWDTTTWEPLFEAPAVACGRAVALDKQGALVAVSTDRSDGPNVQVWAVDSGELIIEMTHQPNWLGAVSFRPTGDHLLTAGGDGSVRIWDVATGGLVALLEGHTGPVEAAHWSPDGATVFSASLDGTVRVWNAATGEALLQLSGLEGVPSIAISPDGRWLATSAGGIAKVWALDLDELIQIAESRLTRSLSEAECTTYHFADCPP